MAIPDGPTTTAPVGVVAEGAPSRGLLHRRIVGVLLVVVFAIGLTGLYYLTSLHGAAANSDGATVVLEGRSVLAGHVALGGWALSLDSFWTVDVPFYVVAVALFGVRELLVHLVPALVAALVVLVGAGLSSLGVAANATRRHGLVARAVAFLAVVVLLGLPSLAFVPFLLLGPLHIVTTLWCLICFYGLRHGRFDKGFVLATLFVAAGLLGDAQMLTLGVAPVVVASLLLAVRRRELASLAPGLSACVLGFSLALIARAVAVAAGTFTINEAAPAASTTEMIDNLRYVADYVPSLLGVGRGPFVATGVPVGLEVLHVLGVIAVVASVLVALVLVVRGLVKGSRAPLVETVFLDDVLLVAVVCGIATFTKLDGNQSLTSARYLSAPLIFSCVLAGRFLGHGLAALSRQKLRATLVSLLALVALCYVTSFGLSFRVARPANAASGLSAFLLAHHLRHGLGDYWSASVTTLSSNDRVVVRPVIDSPQVKVVRYERNSTRDWYKGKHFSFLVYDTALPLVTEQVAAATFGRPTHVYRYGVYEVLTFSRPISVPVKGANA